MLWVIRALAQAVAEEMYKLHEAEAGAGGRRERGKAELLLGDRLLVTIPLPARDFVRAAPRLTADRLLQRRVSHNHLAQLLCVFSITQDARACSVIYMIMIDQ